METVKNRKVTTITPEVLLNIKPVEKDEKYNFAGNFRQERTMESY